MNVIISGVIVTILSTLGIILFYNYKFQCWILSFEKALRRNRWSNFSFVEGWWCLLQNVQATAINNSFVATTMYILQYFCINIVFTYVNLRILHCVPFYGIFRIHVVFTYVNKRIPLKRVVATTCMCSRNQSGFIHSIPFPFFICSWLMMRVRACITTFNSIKL